MSQTYTCTRRNRTVFYSISKSPKTNCTCFLFWAWQAWTIRLRDMHRSQQLSHMGADLTQRYRDLDGQMCLFLPSSAFSQQMLETRDQQRGRTKAAARDPQGPSKDRKWPQGIWLKSESPRPAVILCSQLQLAVEIGPNCILPPQFSRDCIYLFATHCSKTWLSCFREKLIISLIEIRTVRCSEKVT